MPHDHQIRLAAFQRLEELRRRRGPVLGWDDLADGFDADGAPMKFLNPQQGIFKPRQLDAPLSLLTSGAGPYDDRWTEDGLLYEFRTGGPERPENRGLVLACRRRAPLIYFFRVMPKRYLVEFPVFAVHADRTKRRVLLQLDDPGVLDEPSEHWASEDASARRVYLTRQCEARLHQTSFRERVLDAYHSSCALCRLRLPGLLDAAHIRPHAEGGPPIVPNGLALCRIHHAAFDRMFLGIRPEGVIEIHTSVLDEEDGPMLRYGLQQLHRSPLIAPDRRKDRPDPALLAERYRRFLAAQPLR